MTRTRTMTCLIAAGVLLMLAGQTVAREVSNENSIREIPGINSPDVFPLSCIDCHVKSSKRDFRISAMMEEWTTKGANPRLLELTRGVAPLGRKLKGIHPRVERALDDIPLGCLKCHGKDSKLVPPFDRLMHVIHYSGAKSQFIEAFGGECTHCHKFDGKKGGWTIHSGPDH